MRTGFLFFEFFTDLPRAFFQLARRSPNLADQYHESRSIELKDSALRLDGVFLPKTPGQPVYIWEAQFYRSDAAYANLFHKVFRFLEQEDTNLDFVAVLIYPSRSFEPKHVTPYRNLIHSDQFVAVYLDELPEPGPGDFEFSVLKLIAFEPDVALARAQALIPAVQSSPLPDEIRRMLVQFIETVMACRFPNWGLEEVARMLQLTDGRETRLYKQGLEQGHQEGEAQGELRARIAIAKQLLRKGRPVGEIVEDTGLSAEQVRNLIL